MILVCNNVTKYNASWKLGLGTAENEPPKVFVKWGVPEGVAPITKKCEHILGMRYGSEN